MVIIDNIKKFFSPQLSNSKNGLISRNYTKTPTFNPQRQVTGITYKAIDKIGQSVSAYDPFALKPNGDKVVNHPAVTLYKNPNPNTRGVDFAHTFAMLYNIYGENFVYLARGESTRRIKEIYLLNPAQIELKFNGEELIGYIYHKNNGTQVPLTLEEVYHDKRPNPFNPWRGLSVLEKAAVYIDTEIDTSSFTLNYIRNNASPSGIVQLPDMDQEAFKQFAMQWREGYEGPENAGKTAFLRGEAKFQAVGATLKDIDQEVTRKMAKDDVLMMLDVPKPLLGATDDNGFGRGNVETLKYIFAENVVDPLMNRLDYMLEAISESYGQPTDITHTSPIPEDRQFQLEQTKTGVNVWMTVNEARAYAGLEPMPNGDTINPNNKANPEPAKILVTKAKETKKSLNNEQEEFRNQLVENTETYAAKLKRVIAKFANKQQAQVISNINASKKSFEEWLFSIKDESEELEQLITPVLIELMEAESKDVVNFITGQDFEFTPAIKETVAVRVKQISGMYNKDTITALEKTLTEGQAAGESLVKMKKRVEGVYMDAKGYRAERIARTESLKAANLTAEEVYKQNGYSEVEWFANPGACEFCESLDGTTKSIGSNYLSVGDVLTGTKGGQLRIEYDTIGTPPVHPNCTCSIVPR